MSYPPTRVSIFLTKVDSRYLHKGGTGMTYRKETIMSDKALDSSNIDQILKTYIAEEFMFDRPASDLDEDIHLIQEGIIDSLGIFMVISFIDEQFGVQIEADDVVLDNFQSIEAIKSLILARN